MHERTIYITDGDMDQLRNLLAGRAREKTEDREYLRELERELDRAHVVASAEIPTDVVTMNSQVLVRDLDSGRELILTPVFLLEADSTRGKISILAPVGTALLGYCVGDIVEWGVPSGLRRLRVKAILYQPEAAGIRHA